MTNGSATNIFNDRLDLIDISIFGHPNDDSSQLLHLKERLVSITSLSLKSENEIPQLAVCREMMQKLRPQLSKSKSSLSMTMERLETAFAMKAELEDIVGMLITVESTTRSSTICPFVDLKPYQNDLIRIEEILAPLILLSKKQSDELDAFLSDYENAVPPCCHCVFSSVTLTFQSHQTFFVCNMQMEILSATCDKLLSGVANLEDGKS